MERAGVDYWIVKNEIKGEKGNLIEFKDHKFMLQIYRDTTPNQVIKKGAQVGMSTMAILRLLHGAKYLGINQIYTLPTVDDVRTFVPGKVNQIIQMNPCIRAQFSKKDIDSVEQKQLGDAFIYFKGTFTEREAIMLSSDRNFYDEIDKSKTDVIKDYASRLGFSKVRSQYYFSTPTIPDFGIDKLWQESDQKHWRFNCPHCGFRQHMEWEKNVDFRNAKYICQQCQKELSKETIKSGKWEARFPDREVSGYWIPQTIATWRSCADLIKELEDAEDEEYFYNFILGQAYLNPEAKISASLILKNLTATRSDERNSAMGVDVGTQQLHVIVGNEKGVFAIAILEDQPGKPKWQRLEELMDVYEVRYCVIDALPETDKTLEFARKYPYRVYTHYHKAPKIKEAEAVKFVDETKFTEKPKEFEEEIKVISDINRVQDQTIADFRAGKIKFHFKSGDSRIQELISHLQTMYARTVTDKLGQEYREWANTTGKNHFWDALCEFKIALDKKIRYEK